ncbi:MAG: hypothetical protein PHR45_07965 [Muribaculaceae bacterium]|nr:hypothetical protein [Muribaculaceae bacterium]
MKETKVINIFEETDTIIGQIPKKLIRISNIVIWSILVIVIIIGFCVPYKDTVKAPIMITQKDGNTNCKATISSSNYGKIKKGQVALIYLDIYPKDEYGFLEGEVISLNDEYINNGYEVNIKLRSTILSNNENVRLLQKMTGSSEIIISKKPFAYKLFPALNKIIKW